MVKAKVKVDNGWIWLWIAWRGGTDVAPHSLTSLCAKSQNGGDSFYGTRARAERDGGSLHLSASTFMINHDARSWSWGHGPWFMVDGAWSSQRSEERSEERERGGRRRRARPGDAPTLLEGERVSARLSYQKSRARDIVGEELRTPDSGN
mmetsp:Transcript_7537/g.13283  ORF Transcript_7537/g.13283 Transcript_7537/m.13283 type:complete len:150 (+) Transcript_7537:1673-2122(+)